ncbi:MASE4 domain-containing protein [Bradyrhizobium sp. 6(2017)]|uniref:MASE4 domain-containing protein n=1 Tax=Bradyrhizobium sp. 6(2017) TaxID=1197460 RepID=UPI0013E11978|nr:MASE4 domain-containing protein [Bradyrhizobium sp. 6(2017)]QIG92447.1 two-component sensor histidine kinase [Bradyrhizobium sp. 6(2017)]
MRPRRFIGLIDGAAAARPRAARMATLPDGEAGAAVQQEEDFPLIIANLPATGRQKAIAVGVAVLLFIAAAAIAPFASIQLGRADAFIPVLQSALSIVEFVTATLLFAQYSIQPQRALLALASGYIFSGSFAFLQTLTFPGGYAPNGLIGDGPNSPAWIYVLWHTTFPAAILVYALTKDATGAARPGRSVMVAIAITISSVLAVIAGLTWIVTTKTEYLPSFYTNVMFQTPLGNLANVTLLLWGLTAFAVLLFRRRTILDLWLLLTLLAYSPNFLVAIVGSSVRFTIGWYAARCFVLVGSCMLLGVLLIETMFLYSRLASAITLQRRERTNRLLSVEAVASAIAHELRTPLGAIALNASTGLSQLRSTSRELDDMEDILTDIEADSHRAAAMISSIREMTTKTIHRSALTSAEDAARLALRLLKHDLQINEISVATEFQGNLPDVQLDGMELQQVLLNLVRNAIDAMCSSPPEERRLRFKTSFDGQSTVLMSIQDSGPGIPAEDRQRIFDPFFTTKLDGTGLGLAISSTLVVNHGGKLRLVKSDAEGSTFELEMPVGKQPSAA